MTNSRPRDLRERTFLFARDILTFCGRFDRVSVPSRHVAFQLARAGTSVGANAEEAVAAYSRREFASKNAIALREAREARFWLRLAEANALAPPEAIQPLLAESNELIAILTAVVRTAKASAEAIDGRRRVKRTAAR